MFPAERAPASRSVGRPGPGPPSGAVPPAGPASRACRHPRGRSRRNPGVLAAVGRGVGRTVRSEGRPPDPSRQAPRDLLEAAAVGFHGPRLVAARAIRHEVDALSVGRPPYVPVLDRCRRSAAADPSRRAHQEDVLSASATREGDPLAVR